MTDARVVVFGLGGTIAMTAAATGGVAPTLSPRQLLDAVPGLADAGVTLDVDAFRNRPGASLTFADLTGLAAAIRERLTGGATGVVVTQGTDTIEETAFLLDLLHDRPEPVVVTGAMRNPTMAGADGPANLLAAVRVAASPAARGLGCLVVSADEIHAAARVRKTHSTSPATFASPGGGPLGYLVEGVPVIVNRPATRYTLPPMPADATPPQAGATPPQAGATPPQAGATPPQAGATPPQADATPPRAGATPPQADATPPRAGATPPQADATPPRAGATAPRVGLYTATLGDDGVPLTAVAAHLDGLVVAGFGAGHVPDTWLDTLTALAARMPVVLASRTGAGPVLTGTYGFPGSERDLLARGLIPAGFLDPLKARILLHLLLATGAGRAEVAAAFDPADTGTHRAAGADRRE